MFFNLPIINITVKALVLSNCARMYQLARIPARRVSVLRSSIVQSIVWTFAITAEVTSLA